MTGNNQAELEFLKAIEQIEQEMGASQAPEDIKKALTTLITKIPEEHREKVLSAFEEEVVMPLFGEIPNALQLKMLNGVSSLFNGLLGDEINDMVPVKELHGALAAADAVVTMQGATPSPVLSSILEKVGELSDEDFSNSVKLITAISYGHTEGQEKAKQIAEQNAKQTQNANPFRKKYGAPNA